MITLSNIDRFNSTGSSSKGNQIKYYSNNIWYKIDTHGYEGLAECFSSCVESCVVDLGFVPYYEEVFNINGGMYRGCYSYSMFDITRYKFITLRSILKNNHISLSIFKQSSIRKSILDVISTILEFTGINIGKYLADTLFLDSIILNEDRHPMNLGLIYDTKLKKYSLVPIFDNGIWVLCR